MRVILAVILGYGLACLAAASVLVLVGLAAGGSGPLGHFQTGGVATDFLAMTAFIGFYTLPGFLIIRAALHGLGLRHWAFFAAGGAAASVAAVKMLHLGLDPDPWLALAGAVAGIAYLGVERLVRNSRARTAEGLDRA
ncbi:MAG: hypothetical protein N2422_08465 [Rhodobacteraceae bacterium]|nr:hypothetical protein [Paracoccaceae bacterium]